jgi:hypothetical protein
MVKRRGHCFLLLLFPENGLKTYRFANFSLRLLRIAAPPRETFS